MPPVMSVNTPQPQSLEGDGHATVAPLQAPGFREEVESVGDTFLPLKKFPRMQVLSCMVQIETKSFIECTNKGCLYISLTIWDMAYHLSKCEGIKGNDKLKKCRYCPHGTRNMDVLNNHMILSHSYAPEVMDKKNKLEFKDLRQEEREAFLTSPVARAIIRSHWRISYQTKGYIICLTQTCRFVTSLIPVMEDHYIRCSAQIWETLQFACEKCPGKTPSEEALEAHIEECHSAQNVTFNTVQPEAKRFWELSLMLYGASKCVALHCKFIASHINELERHYRYCRVPHVENYEVCDYCGGWCDTSDDKVQHIRALHSHVKSSPDDSIEGLKAMEHLDVMKKLVNLDLNNATFPWIKVMSFGGEAVLNRIVEGLKVETVPRAKIKKSKKKNNKLEVEPSSTKVVPIKKEKPDLKRPTRRKSVRASDIDSDVSLHAIKAEELYNPDKTFLEDLGQAIEVECLETPKVEFEVSVGEQSWKVEAPNLETACEVITRKMPIYTMKGVLAQSIEDSLNLLKIEAKVSSIENLNPKPYAPPKMLSFAQKPSVFESLKKKFDLVRRREEKMKSRETFMTGDSFSGSEVIEVTPKQPSEIPKKRSKRKEFGPGIRPWQSLARIKQKPIPEPEYDDDSPNEGVFDCDSISKQETKLSPSKTQCKTLLPKKKEHTMSIESRNNNDATCDENNRKINAEMTCANKSKRKRSCKLLQCTDESLKLVRDVSLQHGSSAFPVFAEQLINNKYKRAPLVIGYPYSMLKSEHIPINVDKSTQTITRNYSCKTRISHPTASSFRIVPPNESAHPVSVTTTSIGQSRLPQTLHGQKKLVVFRTMAPVDHSNPTGARILKETRVIGNLKQAVIRNLSRVGTNGALGAPQVLRFVSGPISRASLSSGSSGVPFRMPTTLVRCSPPAAAIPANYATKVPSILSAPPTTIPGAPAQAIKTEPLDHVSIEDPNSTPTNFPDLSPTAVCSTAVVSLNTSVGSPCASASVVSTSAAPMASTFSSSPSPTPSLVSASSSPSASVESSSAIPVASTVSSNGASTASVVSSSAALTASTVSSRAAPTASVSKLSSSSIPTASFSSPSTTLSASDTSACSPSPPVMSSSALPSPSDANMSISTPRDGFDDSSATSCGLLKVTVASCCGVSDIPTASSSTSPSLFNRTPKLRTYSSKLRSLLQVAKKARLEIPLPLQGCSKDLSLPEENRKSPIPFEVPIFSLIKSAPMSEEVNNASDNVCERHSEQSSSSCSAHEKFTYNCWTGDNLESDSGTNNKYGIFDEVYGYEGQCAASDTDTETEAGVSKGCMRNQKCDGSDSAIFCGDSVSSRNCNSLSIPFEVFCDSSTAASGGLYNESCPWEMKKSNVLFSIEKPSVSDSPKTASQPTTLHMEVDEDPAQVPQLEAAEVCRYSKGSVKKELVDNGRGTGNPKPNEGEHVNELVTHLTNQDGLQVRNEPMVYVLNKILLEPRSLAHQRKVYFKSLNDEEEELRRFEELVHYLTHYNRRQFTNNPIVYIATRNVPSTSKNSNKEPKESGRGRGSQQSNTVDARKSEKITTAEKSVVPQKSDTKSVEVPLKKRQRKSAVVDSAEASSSRNQNESEQLETIRNSNTSNGQDLSIQAPIKKRGRKPKVNQEKSISTEGVARDLANTKLDDPSENGQEASKTMPTKRPGRKSKQSMAAENETVENCLQENAKKGDQQSKTELMDLNVQNVEVEKPKTSGKKSKNPIAKSTDILLEMEVEPGDDYDVPRTSAGRQRRACSKQYAESIKTDEDIVEDVGVGRPPKPKKRGRPSRAVDSICPPKESVDPTPEQSEDDNGKRFLYHENDADSDDPDELVPAYDRIIFNSTLPNPNKLVTCAICNNNMTASVYKTTHLYKHNHVCWLKNEEPMDLTDELTLERHLYKVYIHLRKPFHCEVCGKAVKSARGFISHKRFCGKTLEERREKMVACSVCSRLLKPSSLSMHIQHHHSRQAHPSPVKEEPVDVDSPSNAAASLERIPAAVEATGPVHIDEDAERAEADSQPWIRRHYHLEKRRITQVLKAIFSDHVSEGGVARCLNAGCTWSDANIKNVMEHYRACDKISLDFKCKVCAYMERNEAAMIYHVRTMHTNKANEFKERKSILGEDASLELPEFCGKFLPYLKVAEANTRSVLFLQPALYWTYKMKSDFVASGSIFPDISAVDNEFKVFEDFPPSHFELRDESMRIAFNESTPVLRLSKLTSMQASNDMVMLYTGGVVRSLDWFPSEEEQYLIIAIGSIGPDSINVRSTKSGPSHLQIWSAGKLNNFESFLDLPLKFEFALCHDFGEVWDLQCCPGGQPDAARLGLVALATSSGKVAVYAVPSVCSSKPVVTNRATKPEPTLVLETGLHESFHVSKVAWSKVKPHRFVAGGFSNGMVAIWDLTTTSILLRSGNTILPFKMFHPHFTTITGLSFSPVNEYYIVTTCADKSSKFFNLEDTSISHVEFNRGLFMDVAWLHHWMSVVAALDDNTTLGTTTAMIHPLRNFIYQGHPSVTQAESCCLSVSVNDWLNAFACSYDNGQVLLTFARKHCHMMDERKRGHAQLITPEFYNFHPTSQEFTDCQSYAATSENFGIIFNSDFTAAPTTKLKPVHHTDVTHFPSTAANKVSFNPNMNSFLTMAIGYHSGFVILGRLKLHPTELADLRILMAELQRSGHPAPSEASASEA